MPSFEIVNGSIIDAYGAASTLQAWLRPGLLAYIIGANASALAPHVAQLTNERNAMLDEAGSRYPEFADSDAPDGSYKKGDPHPQAGEVVRQDLGGGQFMTPYRSPEVGKEYVRRVAELMAAKTTIVVDERLTFEHMKQIDKERLETPRGLNGAPPTEMSVDFGALAVLIERPQYTAEGVLVPPSPSSNGVRLHASLIKE